MPKKPETELPDLSEYEEEAIPFNDVMRRLMQAPPPADKSDKPKPKKKKLDQKPND